MRATWFIALVACGGAAYTDDAAPIDATVEVPTTNPCVVDAGTLVTSPASLGPICPPCPQALPSNDSACDPQLAGIECEYGESDDWQCNAIARCTAVDGGTRWSVGKGVPCPLVRGGPCPFQKPSVFGCCSAPPDLRCDYGDAYCVCDARGGTSQANPGWWCIDMSCRGKRPRLGCSCTQAGGCNTCAQPTAPACVDGGWRILALGPCK